MISRRSDNPYSSMRWILVAVTAWFFLSTYALAQPNPVSISGSRTWTNSAGVLTPFPSSAIPVTVVGITMTSATNLSAKAVGFLATDANGGEYLGTFGSGLNFNPATGVLTSSGGSGSSVAAGTNVTVLTNGFLLTISGVTDTNAVNGLLGAVTNGAILNLSNYSLTISQNATNNVTLALTHTVTVAGTANQIASSVATAQQLGNNPATTLSLPSPVVAPGQVSAAGITNTLFSAIGAVTNDAAGKLYTTPLIPAPLMATDFVAVAGANITLVTNWANGVQSITITSAAGGSGTGIQTNSGTGFSNNLTNLTAQASLTITNASSGLFFNPTGTNVTMLEYNTNAAGVIQTNVFKFGGSPYNLEVANTNAVDTFTVTQDGIASVGTNAATRITLNGTNGNATVLGTVAAAGVTNTLFAAIGVVTNDANGKEYTTPILPPPLLNLLNATNNDSLVTNYAALVVGVGATNEALRQATSLTNGAINNLSNYALTISQNATNEARADALGATNYAIARNAGFGTNTTVYTLLTLNGVIYDTNLTSQFYKFGSGTNTILLSIGTNAAGNGFVTNVFRVGNGVTSNEFSFYNARGDTVVAVQTNGAMQLGTNAQVTIDAIGNIIVVGGVTSSTYTNTGSILSIDGIGYSWPASQTGGNLFNNGSGVLSWVAGTNVSIPNTITPTNFVVNTRYTNSSGSIQLVDATVALITASVAGVASMDLMADQAGGTAFVLQDRVAISTLLTGLTVNYTNNLSGALSNNAAYYFTNTSSGAGNSSVIVPSTGELVTLADGSAAGVALEAELLAATNSNTLSTQLKGMTNSPAVVFESANLLPTATLNGQSLTGMVAFAQFHCSTYNTNSAYNSNTTANLSWVTEGAGSGAIQGSSPVPLLLMPISASGTNQWWHDFTMPPTWNSNGVLFSVGLIGGTNAPTTSTNVIVSVTGYWNGTASTTQTVTNNFPLTGMAQTNVQVVIPVTGTITPKESLQIVVQYWAVGNGKITNNLYSDMDRLVYTNSVQQNGLVTGW